MPEDPLTAALTRHGMEIPPHQTEQLDRYAQLLWEWNQKLNLTRHTDYEKFVLRDLVDTLAFSQFLKPEERVLDVGSGGGVPGVTLSIIRPDLRVELSESVGKKGRALADIVARLELPAPVHQGRAELLLSRGRFDTLTIRAVARLKKLLEWFRPHWGRFGRMLVLKGPGWVEERGEARHHHLMEGLALRKLTAYPLPGTNSESVLLQLCPEERIQRYESP